jgi:hypothetical protein
MKTDPEKKNPCVGRQYDIKFNDIDFVDTPRDPQ